MTVELWQFILICPLTMLAGFVDAVAGGGGLISLPAYMIAGLPVHQAIATNKLSSSMGTAVATEQYAKKGFIPWKQAAFCVISALLGSNIGAHLALLLRDAIFKNVMVIILPLTAFFVLQGKTIDVEYQPFSNRKTVMLSMTIALCIGMYDGFYGPGTGTFLLLLLTAVAHMPLREANGITKMINLSSNIAALLVFLHSGNVILQLGLAAGLFGIVGNYLGAHFFAQKGAKVVKPIILFVLTIFFIRLLLEIIFHSL